MNIKSTQRTKINLLKQMAYHAIFELNITARMVSGANLYVPMRRQSTQ